MKNLIIGIIGLGAFFFLLFKLAMMPNPFTEYERKCRESGGVPIHGHGQSINCAKEGYIDIK